MIKIALRHNNKISILILNTIQLLGITYNIEDEVNSSRYYGSGWQYAGISLEDFNLLRLTLNDLYFAEQDTQENISLYVPYTRT